MAFLSLYYYTLLSSWITTIMLNIRKEFTQNPLFVGSEIHEKTVKPQNSLFLWVIPGPGVIKSFPCSYQLRMIFFLEEHSRLIGTLGRCSNTVGKYRE